MRSFLISGFLASGMAILGGVASAQDSTTQQPLGEEYCVYEKLTSTLDYEIIAEAYLFGDDDDADMLATLKKAADACAAEHGMSEDQKSAASEVGIYGATADYLAEELMMVGVSQDAVDGLFGVIEEMSDQDLDVLFEEDWRKNEAMSGRLKAAVIAHGIPGDADSVDLATQVVELSAFAMDAVIGYALAEAGDGAS